MYGEAVVIFRQLTRGSLLLEGTVAHVEEHLSIISLPTSTRLGS